MTARAVVSSSHCHPLLPRCLDRHLLHCHQLPALPRRHHFSCLSCRQYQVYKREQVPDKLRCIQPQSGAGRQPRHSSTHTATKHQDNNATTLSITSARLMCIIAICSWPSCCPLTIQNHNMYTYQDDVQVSCSMNLWHRLTPSHTTANTKDLTDTVVGRESVGCFFSVRMSTAWVAASNCDGNRGN